MRKAVGILMIILGILLPGSMIALTEGDLTLDFLFDPFVILVAYIPAIFIVIGGVSCLWKRSWGLCFASALAAISVTVYWAFVFYWLRFAWVAIATGILPMVFICLRKKEWQKP
jgi:uncharacterized membrane protein YqaE (UPF0057 family)